MTPFLYREEIVLWVGALADFQKLFLAISPTKAHKRAALALSTTKSLQVWPPSLLYSLFKPLRVPPLKPPSSVRRPAGVAVVARQARVPRGVLPAPLRGRHRRQGAAPHDAAAADCWVSQHTFINVFVKIICFHCI